MNEGRLIGKMRYPKLSELVEGLLTVLHSNTDVTQLFGQVNLIRIFFKRNKLNAGTMDCIL